MNQWALIAVCSLGILALGWLAWRIFLAPITTPDLGFKTEVLELPEGPLHYLDVGSGPPIILIHGIGANLLCWRWLWPFLESQFRVIALDLPGFGRSHKNGNDFGLDAQTRNIMALMDQLNIKECHLIGNSMGGNIALWMGAHFPDRVTSITVIAPATDNSLVPKLTPYLAGTSALIAPFTNKFLMNWAHRRTVSKPDLVDSIRINETWSTYGRNHRAIRSFILATVAITDRRMKDTLTKIVDPVLVLWGANDKLVPQKVIQLLQSSLKKSYVKIHQSGGHHLQEDEPEWVAKEFLSFLSLAKVNKITRLD